MKIERKKFYVPPKVEVTQVILEGVITASPIHSVEVKDWEYEGLENPENHADIWLPF